MDDEKACWNPKEYYYDGRCLRKFRDIPADIMEAMRKGAMFPLVGADGRVISTVLMDSYDQIRESQ